MHINSFTDRFLALGWIMICLSGIQVHGQTLSARNPQADIYDKSVYDTAGPMDVKHRFRDIARVFAKEQKFVEATYLTLGMHRAA